jgi:NADPH:quinone reductase-like Zn-dependent oxidoreductase
VFAGRMEALADGTALHFLRDKANYDVVGTSSFGRCRRALAHGGMRLTTAPGPAILLRMLWTSRFGNRKALVAFAGLRPASERGENLLYIKELAEASALVPVLACYPLDQGADAHWHVDTGHKKGNVVVTCPVDKRSLG